MFTGDSRRVAVALGYAVRMIDVATGKELRQFEDQRAGIPAVALSPDERTVAASCRMIKLWDVATGQEKMPPLKGHRAGVVSVAFSPDGTLVATGSDDQTVKLWDIATRRERMTLEGHGASVRSVAFRPDGHALASLGFDPDLILWGLPDGKQLRSWKDVSGEDLGFSPDGHWLATRKGSERSAATLWNVSTGNPRRLPELGDGSFQFSPDSKKQVFAGESGWSPRKRRLVVWDIEGGKAESTVEDGLLPAQLRNAALSPDGQTVALGGRTSDDGEKGRAVTVLWSLAEERPLYRLDQDAQHLAFSPDGRTLLGVGRDGIAMAWDPRNGTLRGSIRVCEAGYCPSSALKIWE
jgi:WD40 repeat protein